MTPSEFLSRADAVLRAIEDAVSAIGDDGDIDIEASRAGNVVTIEFDGGSKIIVNSQEPMQEMWMAARAGGFHFRWDGARWVDTKNGAELFTALSEYASQQAGAPLVLKP